MADSPGAGAGPLGVDLIDRLSVAECGVVLGLARRDAGRPGGGVSDGAPDILAAAAARLGGSEGPACRAALEALDGLPGDERQRWLAHLARAVREPVPAGIERVHPGWLRAALAGESTPLLLAVVAGLPRALGAVADEIIEARGEEPAVRVAAAVGARPLAELRRALFAGFVDMPDTGDVTARAGGPGAPLWQRLAVLPSGALLAELEDRGAEVLGSSLHGAPREVLARAAASLGERAARVMLAAAQASPAPPAQDRGRARALVAASAATPPEVSGVGPAQTVGLEAWAEALAATPAVAARALAQRLPPALGRLLLRAKDRRRVKA